MVSTSKGLAVACLSGIVFWFELSEKFGLQNVQFPNNEGVTMNKNRSTLDKNFYKFNKIIKIPNDCLINLDEELTELQKITYMAVSPSEEVLVACTDDHQLYQINLNNINLTLKNIEDNSNVTSDSDKVQKQLFEPVMFEPVSELFHKGQILDLDVCLRKPLIATCATDQSIKIWNFEKK